MGENDTVAQGHCPSRPQGIRIHFLLAGAAKPSAIEQLSKPHALRQPRATAQMMKTPRSKTQRTLMFGQSTVPQSKKSKSSNNVG